MTSFRNESAVVAFFLMAKLDPLSATDILALDLALEAECAGVPINLIAKAGCCSEQLIALAEHLRGTVAEMRTKLHADADDLGMTHGEIDVVFSDILSEMLGPRGMMH